MTRDDYIKRNEKLNNNFYSFCEYSEPKYNCPKCKTGKMRKNLSIVLASYPPKYQYECDCCGYVDYLDF